MFEEIFEYIKKVLKENYSDFIGDKEITADAKLTDLGINSLAFIKTVVELEEKYDIDFKDDEIEVSSYETLSDLINTVIKKLN